jgi:hypothetical protein
MRFYAHVQLFRIKNLENCAKVVTLPILGPTNRYSNKTAPYCPRILKLAYSKRAQIFESLMYIHKNYLTASGISFVLTSLREFDHVFMFVSFPLHFSICITK